MGAFATVDDYEARQGELTEADRTRCTVQQGYQETVVDQAAYDEQVQTSVAWDETVTMGYKCSSCGATK